MKAALLVLCCFLPLLSYAESIRVVTATSKWTKPDNGRAEFSELEQLGVRKSAELKALNSCEAQALSNCTIKSSAMIECNVYSGYAQIACSATAVVHGTMNESSGGKTLVCGLEVDEINEPEIDDSAAQLVRLYKALGAVVTKSCYIRERKTYGVVRVFARKDGTSYAYAVFSRHR